jgi:gamma-glutamyltranspeptidase/glutathione hydrolase
MIEAARTIRSRMVFAASVAFVTSLAGCAPAPRAPYPIAEAHPGAGVAAASPEAVDAGLAVLRQGGSAVDAAVAVQAVLGLVEPQSSGIGGGGFLMYYDAVTHDITMMDGRETAPMRASPRMFLDSTGKELPFNQAVITGNASGVPGVMAMLGEAHKKFGRLPWNRLFDAPTRLADSGFVVTRRLGRFANGRSTQNGQPDVKRLFLKPDGTTIREGDRHRNPAYGRAMRALAADPRALLKGPLADSIVARVKMPPGPSAMTLQDLARYRPVEREPLCAPYRAYRVCVPPPPSSGVSLLQLLAMLDQTDIATRKPEDPQSWYLFAEASRLMYADRDKYIGDGGFVKVPVRGLLDPDYVRQRVAMIGPRATATAYPAGTPPGAETRADDAGYEEEGTSHFVIIDARGNVVSMTTTVESIFGSGRAVSGFLLNNQMTDFSFDPMLDGQPSANAIAGGKRPRSSMVPAIILDGEGRFVGAIGSPGGSAILAYVGKLAVGLLAWDMPMQQAIDLPNIYARGTRWNGEASRLNATVRNGLAARGVTVTPGEGEDSGLHGVILRPGRPADGGADTRRDGQWRYLRPPPAAP